MAQTYPEFKPAFTPATFGWDNALKLNCLQLVYEKYGTNDHMLVITGTESDADALVDYFTNGYHAADIISRFLLSSEPDTRLLVNEFRTIFSCEHPEFNYGTRPTHHQKIHSEIDSLGHHLRFIRHAVFFLSGRNFQDEGAAYNALLLNRDMCEMIMASL